MAQHDQARRGWGPLLFVGVLVLDLLSTSRYAVPGASASLVAQHLHLTAFPPMNHVVWSWVVRALSVPAGSHAPFALNLFSAFCGAAVAWQLYVLIANMPPDHEVRKHAPRLADVSGLVAAVFLAVSVPFWMASDRAHPATFDMLALLTSLVLLRRFGRTAKARFLYLSAMAYALGLADSATFLLFSPFIALYAIFLLSHHRMLSAATLLRCTACLLLFPALLLVATLEYTRLPAASWRAFNSSLEVFRYYLLDYRGTLTSSVSRHGWLLLVMVSAVPWLMGFVAMRRHRAWDRGPGTFVLYVVMTALAAIVLFNGPIAPWTVMGATPLLVMPYLFIASYAGFMVARWGAMMVMRRVSKRQTPPRAAAILGTISGALLAVAAVRNAPAVSTRAARDVHRLAAASLDHLEGRTYLVTEGALDVHLVIEAHLRGQRVTLFDARSADLPAYRRYMASTLGAPRLKSLALVGLGPLVVDWLRTGTNVEKRLAIESTPDLWLSEGYEPVPVGSLYLAARDAASLDSEHVASVCRRFWDLAVPALARMTNGTPDAQRLAKPLSLAYSHVANDAGVFFENLGRSDDAMRAYRRALDFNGENLSAALNFVTLARSSGATAGVDRAEAVVARGREAASRLSPGDAALKGGHIRLKESVDLVWATTNAVAAQDSAWRAAMGAYLSGDRVEARRLVEHILEADADRESAWILLARIAYDQGDLDGVYRCLRQMRSMGREWPALLVILGRMAMDRDDLASAREYLERAAQLRPGDVSILEILVQMDLRAKDYARAEKRLRWLLALEPENATANRALGLILLDQKRYNLAEDALRRSAERRRDAETLADLAWLMQRRGDLTNALDLATEAVQVNGRRCAARDVRGLVLMKLGRLAEAREELEQAVSLDSREVAAQLHLAQLLARTGEAQEAHRIAHRLLNGGFKLDRDQEADLRALLGPG